jgi:hypothetical protein
MIFTQKALAVLQYNMGLAAKNAGPEVGIKACHYRHDNDQSHNADRYSGNGEKSNQGNKCLFLSCPEIARAYKVFK